MVPVSSSHGRMNLKKFSKKLVGNEEERAVSPVIGVILMVAITVILAAVIAAFVLDMGDSMGNEPVNAVASIDESDNSTVIEVSVDNLGNADGIVVVEPDGTPYSLSDDDVLQSTGESQTFDSLDDDTKYTVQAYQGELESVDESMDSQTDETTIVGEFETGS